MLKKLFSIAALLAVSTSVFANEIEMASLAPQTVVAQSRAYATNAQQACSAFATKTASSLCNSFSQANKAVDTAALNFMPWFKNHTNALTASKVVIAVTAAFVLKKVYDKIKCRLGVCNHIRLYKGPFYLGKSCEIPGGSYYENIRFITRRDRNDAQEKCDATCDCKCQATNPSCCE